MTAQNPRHIPEKHGIRCPEVTREVDRHLTRATELMAEIEIDLREGVDISDTERVAFIRTLAAVADTRLRMAQAEIEYHNWKEHQ